MSETLEQLRERVDRLGFDLLELLRRRALVTIAIADEKRRLGLPLRDLCREEQLLDALAKVNRGPLTEHSLRRVVQEVIDACVDAMGSSSASRLRVGAGTGPPIGVNLGSCCIGAGRPLYIAGPCAVESEAQMERVARGLAAAGVRLLRGGAFKPRTSPYAFQGLGLRGLELLADAGRRHGLATVSEATGPDNVDLVARYADMVQIGARNMYNYELLKAAGRTGKPVLLKRAFSATLDEWLHAAEYVATAGSESIVLCERGVRGFSRETRNTLDLSIVPLAQMRSRLPVIVDVSHATGRRDILAPLARAAFASGASGVMIEVHPDPDAAFSDADQQLALGDFQRLKREVAGGLARLANDLSEPWHQPGCQNGETSHATQRSLQFR